MKPLEPIELDNHPDAVFSPVKISELLRKADEKQKQMLEMIFGRHP